MPRRSLTAEQVDAFRARAIRAATGLFAARGYPGVTLRSVAAELGVSPMTPYRYFENKDELFAMVRTEACRRFGDAQRDALEAAGDERDELRALGMAYIRFALDEPDAYHIIFELSQAPVGTYPGLLREQERAFSYLHAAVDRAVAANILDGDPLRRAHLLWAQMHGLLSLHLGGKLVMGCSLEDLLPEILQQPRAAG